MKFISRHIIYFYFRIFSLALILNFPVSSEAQAYNLLEAMGLKDPKDSIDISVSFSPDRCSSVGSPLLIEIYNGSNAIVEYVKFDVVGRVAGRSTNIYYNQVGGYGSDAILQSGERDVGCWGIPNDGAGDTVYEAQRKYGDEWREGLLAERIVSFPLNEVVWSAKLKQIRTAD